MVIFIAAALFLVLNLPEGDPPVPSATAIHTVTSTLPSSFTPTGTDTPAPTATDTQTPTVSSTPPPAATARPTKKPPHPAPTHQPKPTDIDDRQPARTGFVPFFVRGFSRRALIRTPGASRGGFL
jgi:outer membrane biosynthesis protein TonB